MNSNLNWLKPKVANILRYLLDEKKINLTQLQKEIGENYISIYSALNPLIDAHLVNEERKPSDKLELKQTAVIGVSRILFLIPKGKKIAEKLVEIKKIMEEVKK